jgi:hypothetical protein
MKPSDIIVSIISQINTKGLFVKIQTTEEEAGNNKNSHF